MVASRENFPLLAELLAEQQRLDTPVARFAAGVDARAPAPPAPQLIPLSAPGPGERYAFEVDLDACSGCKSCVAACHSLNGLDETETWRDVGVLVSPVAEHPFTQTVTTACHHCAEPACLQGCPVLAYEQDPRTGIVRHLDDQCIGCSYCILKCPYDVPKYSARLGIVRKCDMCHGRLAAGEAPACAQACPTHAITIVTVAKNRIPETGNRIDNTGNRIPDTGVGKQEPTRPSHESPVSSPRLPVSGFRSPVSGISAPFLPATPDPSYTRPSTRYVSARPLPAGLVAGDAGSLRPQPAHLPLVAMLTLLPFALGLNLAALVPGASLLSPAGLRGAAWGVAAAGLAASVFHLGQPLRAWRIFLGWRRSWLSREAMLFGAWFAVLSLALIEPRATATAAVVGGLALFCSVMIYVDTRRRGWRLAQTAPRFFGTSALVVAALFAPLLGAAAVALKLAWELASARRDARATRLLRGPLRRVATVRIACGALGAALLAVAATSHTAATLAGLSLVLAGEALERLLFFRAVDAPKMPGLPTA